MFFSRFKVFNSADSICFPAVEMRKLNKIENNQFLDLQTIHN